MRIKDNPVFFLSSQIVKKHGYEEGLERDHPNNRLNEPQGQFMCTFRHLNTQGIPDVQTQKTKE